MNTAKADASLTPAVRQGPPISELVKDSASERKKHDSDDSGASAYLLA